MKPESFPLREMLFSDCEAVLCLMSRTPGVSVRDADSPAAIGRFLERNPGLSFVAERDGRIVGCLMAGHDGRRGALYHLAVDADARRQGLASALVAHCLGALEKRGIRKTHVDVFRSNADGNAFWEAAGWTRRDDLYRYSMICGGGSNA